MAKVLVPNVVSDITDREFFQALRLAPGQKDAQLLREAIARGKAGEYDAAYTALGAYHRQALAKEWEVLRDEHLQAQPPAAQVLQNLLDHKITAWHVQEIQFGDKIDWFPPLPHDCRHGFHYLFWLTPAVRAYVQTGQERWRNWLIDILTQYFQAREDPRWAEHIRPLVFTGLGMSGRTPRLLTAYLELLHRGDLPARTIAGFLQTFLGYGRQLDRILQSFVPANNGFSVSCCTLLRLARLFPEFKQSPAWDRKAVDFTVQQAKEGFFSDGGNRERVWGYGLMHVDALTSAYEVAKRHGGLGRHEKTILSTIRKAYQWYAKTSGPGPKGLFPTYGDAGMDNGLHSLVRGQRFFPPTASGLWGVDRSRSCILHPSGFAALRNGDKADSTFINISFGPFAGWHSHWDLLSMNFWSQGVRLLEELCRFGPYANPLDVLFRAPESHNQVLIDGMVYDSRMVRGDDVAWYSDDRIDYFSASHRAYRYFIYGRDSAPVSPNIEAIVRRTVVLVKNPGYAVVLDSVSDVNHPIFNRAITQHWHSPFPFRVTGPAQVRLGGRHGCLMLWAQPQNLRRLETSVDFTAAEMTHVGHTEDRYGLRARRWLDLDHQGSSSGFTTVIYPFHGAPPKVEVRELPARAGDPWRAEALEVTSPAGTDLIVLNPERLPGVKAGRAAMTDRALVQLGQGRGEVHVK